MGDVNIKETPNPLGLERCVSCSSETSTPENVADSSSAAELR